jgi:hypothetical protein
MQRVDARVASTVLVVVQGEPTDTAVTELACQVARAGGAVLRALYLIEVPPAYSLAEWRAADDAQGRAALAVATEVAGRLGCNVRGTILPTRSFGQAIVDEAAERAAASLVLAMPQRPARRDAVALVLREAACAVLLWRAPHTMPDSHRPPRAPAT